MRTRIATVIIAGAFALSGLAGSGIAQASHSDASACETAAQTAVAAQIAEARADVTSGLRKGGKLGRRWIKEGVVDLKEATAAVLLIESTCEPNEGSDGEGGGN